MRQQINLYQPILIQERTPLSARVVGVALVVVVAGLTAFSVLEARRVDALGRSVEEMRAQQTQQQALLEQAGQLQSNPASVAELEARVRRLQATVDERRRALEVLRSGAAGRTAGFAERLDALARRHLDGLWLDYLQLSGSDGSMALAGATLNADLVPKYLQSLARDEALSGARFDDFIIERPALASAKDDAEASVKKAPDPRHVRFRMGRGAAAKTVGEAHAAETPS